eukprot:CAMPEP_0170555726 /NCGR_PEP_ID=MMETSP0211-20121228/13569_1 /TAXON_ID=311385 /ORGANISM="Pseudokeronopsis sp., Strain OXSARD2" /LENGTH=49 /DNA_ID=CAMNT_0010865705 /DNA_START=1675 /DNA_END=1824 /DNA_ORIENTATION=+
MIQCSQSMVSLKSNQMALDESSCMMFDSNSQYLTNGGNKIEDQESSNDF